jgi:hypothetical protein
MLTPNQTAGRTGRARRAARPEPPRVTDILPEPLAVSIDIGEVAFI